MLKATEAVDEPEITITDLRASVKSVITRKEAASVLGVDPRTITTAIDSGEIPAIRLGARVLIPREKFLRLFD